MHLVSEISTVSHGTRSEVDAHVFSVGFTFVFVPKVVENLRDRYKVLSHVFYMFISNLKNRCGTRQKEKKMKKVIFSVFVLAGIFCAIDANAQYKPTAEDIGKDCTTQNGKLGTWKEVNVKDSRENNYSNSNSNSFSGSASASIGSASIGGNASHSRSNSQGNSRGEEISYKDIRCVEDKNATLPQQTPVRW